MIAVDPSLAVDLRARDVSARTGFAQSLKQRGVADVLPDFLIGHGATGAHDSVEPSEDHDAILAEINTVEEMREIKRIESKRDHAAERAVVARDATGDLDGPLA